MVQFCILSPSLALQIILLERITDNIAHFFKIDFCLMQDEVHQMQRNELSELHFITPILNISSILTHGILSHTLAKKIGHHSIAMQEVQDRRKKVTIPGGKLLHDYANLYICARNPMLLHKMP